MAGHGCRTGGREAASRPAAARAWWRCEVGRDGRWDYRCNDRWDDFQGRAAFETVQGAIEPLSDALAPSDAHAVTAGILHRLREHHLLPASPRTGSR